MDKSVPRVIVLASRGREVRMDKSVPQFTVWHHSAEPRDDKTMTLGTDLSSRTSHSCQILIVHVSYLYIRITCPCNEHPLTPHFYIEKVGFNRVYIFFLFLLQNIDCGYSLEPPRSFIAHQTEESDVLPWVRNSYITHVISPKVQNNYKEGSGSATIK